MEDDESHSFLTISDFCLQHYQLPLPVFCVKNDHYRSKPSRDNLQVAAPNSNVSQKNTRSSVQQSIFMLRFVYFISCKTYGLLPIWWAPLHWRSNGTYWNVCTVNVTDKVPYTCKPKFQKKATDFSHKTNHKNSFLLGFFIRGLGVSNRYFCQRLYWNPLTQHCVVKLPANERLDNFCASFPFFDTHLRPTLPLLRSNQYECFQHFVIFLLGKK